MKKLINKITGEIAYLELDNNTIYFSNSKTTHRAIITTDENEKITKITALPESETDPVFEQKTAPRKKTNTKSNNTKPIINTSEPASELEFNLNEMFPESELFEFENPFDYSSLETLYRISA